MNFSFLLFQGIRLCSGYMLSIRLRDFNEISLHALIDRLYLILPNCSIFSHTWYAVDYFNENDLYSNKSDNRYLVMELVYSFKEYY